MTIYKNVTLKDDLFCADEVEVNGFVSVSGNVTISKHVAVLYYVTESKGYSFGPLKQYEPILFDNADMLKPIHNLFTGCMQLEDFKVIDSILVRYGWMDKNLNSLRWMKIVDLHQRYSNNTLIHSDKSKLNRVLQQITLSKRDIVKYDYIEYRNALMADELESADDEIFALGA